MQAIEVIVLLYCLSANAYCIYTDKAEFEAFKLCTGTGDRQRFYVRWLAKSVLLFFVAGVASLAILGRLPALIHLPREFHTTQQALLRAIPSGHSSHDFLVGFGSALLAIMVLGAALAPVLQARFSSRKQALTVGDWSALIPRNASEMLHGAALSCNAGLSEEIFFRLLLPLVLTLLFGHALWCFIAAAVIFGVAHLYQGILGVIATTVLGVLLTAIYVATGRLWIVILIHAMIDLNGLVVRPAIGWLVTARRPQSV